MKEFVKVAQIGDPWPVRMKRVSAGGEHILLARIDGQYYAVADDCTHAGCSLSDGALQGGVVLCPCHGSQFDVSTGEVITGPASYALAKYTVKVEGQDIFVGPG